MNSKDLRRHRHLIRLLCFSAIGLFSASCGSSSGIQAIESSEPSSATSSVSSAPAASSATTAPSSTPSEESPLTSATNDQSQGTPEESSTEVSHQYGDWSTVKEPTCDQPGEEVRDCVDDPSLGESREIDPRGHDYAFDSFVWAEDRTAKAKLICTRDPSHIAFEDAEMKVEDIVEVTDHARGLRSYTASYGERSETKELPVPIPHTNRQDLEPSEGLVFELDSTGQGYALTYYEGDSPSLVIPATYNGLPVTTIGAGPQKGLAVKKFGRYGIRRVIIPDSVTTIRALAFFQFEGLVSVTLGANVATIEAGAFQFCDQLLEIYNRSSLPLEKGSTDYGYVAAYAKDIYTAPNYETKIRVDNNDFVLYEDGEETLLLGHESIETRLKVPSGVTGINEHAFWGAKQYLTADLPSSLTSIGDNAFSGCVRLVEIYDRTDLEITLGSMENGRVAQYAKSIIRAPEDESILHEDADGFVTYEYEGRIHLAEYAGKAETVSIPEEVVEVDAEAFFGCESKEIALHSGLEKISNLANEYATNFQRYLVPETVNRLNASLFLGNSLIIDYPGMKTPIKFEEPTGWVTSTGVNLSAYSLSDENAAGKYLREICANCDWIERK